MVSELFSKLEFAKNLSVGISREGLPLSEAVSADRGQAAWVLLINDSDQCLGHSEGSVVKADIGHFALLIKTFVIETKLGFCNFIACNPLKCPLGGDKLSKKTNFSDTIGCRGSDQNQTVSQTEFIQWIDCTELLSKGNIE